MKYISGKLFCFGFFYVFLFFFLTTLEYFLQYEIRAQGVRMLFKNTLKILKKQIVFTNDILISLSQTWEGIHG